MGVVSELKKETPVVRIAVAATITLLLLGLPMLASGSAGAAVGLFGGGFVVVFFGGGWVYDKVRGLGSSTESQTAG